VETLTAFRVLHHLAEKKSLPASSIRETLDVSQHELLQAIDWLCAERLVNDRGDRYTISDQGEVASRIMNPPNDAPPTDDPMLEWLARQSLAQRVDIAQISVQIEGIREGQNRNSDKLDHHHTVLFGNGKEGERIGIVAKLRLMAYVQLGTAAAVALLAILVFVLFVYLGSAM
jgi:hypothetical protein